MNVLNYNQNIQVLRAISVIAVLIYHLNLLIDSYRIFPGGFLGVDVFFLISGFVITKKLTEDNGGGSSWNYFDFKNFYIDRIKRLYTPVFITVIFSLILFFYCFPVKLYNQLLQSSFYSILFLGNFHYYLIGTEYASDLGIYNPLLHLWSLGVEFQFYLLFPFLLLLIGLIKKKSLRITVILFIIVFGTYIFKDRYSLQFSFYLGILRIFEFLSGTLLYLLYIQKIKFNNIITQLLPAVGLITVLVSFVYFDENYLKPSFFTFIPLLGASLIVLFSNKNFFLDSIICNKYLVRIGFYSFSIYLFHYPLISFLRLKGYLAESSSVLNFILIFFILLFLSGISYHLIETKLKKNIFNLKYHAISFVFIITALFFSMNADLNKDYYQSNLKKTNVPKNYKFDNFYYYLEWHKNLKKLSQSEYENQGNKKILVLGDSLAVDLYGIVKENINFYSNYDIKLHYNENVFSNFLNLENLVNKTFFNSADIIFIRFNFNRSNLNFKVLEKFLQKYQKQKKIVLIFQDYYHKMIHKNLTLLDYQIISNNNEFELDKIEKMYFISRVKILNKPFLDLKNKFHNIYFFNIGNIFCNAKKKSCKVLDNDGYKLFWDQWHLTKFAYVFFSKKVNQSLFKILYN